MLDIEHCDDDGYELIVDETGAWNLWLIMHMAKAFLQIGPPAPYQENVLASIEHYQDLLESASAQVARKSIQFWQEREAMLDARRK